MLARTLAGAALCALVACSPHQPDPWTPTPTTPTTADTGALADTGVSPPGWGTCGTLRSVWIASGAQEEWVTGSSPAPDGGSDLVIEYNGPVTLDPGGPNEIELVPLGESAHAVVRTTADGGLGWVLPLDGTSQAFVGAIAPDPAGGLWVAGAGDALSAFAGGPPLGGLGESDAFVGRLGADGALRWVRSFGSVGDDVFGAVAALPDGGVVVGGSFRGEIGLGPDAILALPEGAITAALLARFDPDGALVWVQAIGGAASTLVTDLVYDPDTDSISVLGTLSGEGSTVFGAGTPEERPVTPGTSDAYLARYDGDGTFRWVAVAGDRVYPQDLDLLPDGAVLAAGHAYDAATFGRGEPAEQTLESPEALAWLARYEGDGRLGWVTSASSPQTAYAHAVVALPGGGAAVAGGFGESVVLGDGEPAQTRFVAEEAVDGFLAVFDPQGRLECALQLPVLDPEVGYFGSVSFDALRLLDDGGLELVGSLRGSAVFGAGSGAEVTVTAAERDGFQAIVDLE